MAKQRVGAKKPPPQEIPEDEVPEEPAGDGSGGEAGEAGDEGRRRDDHRGSSGDVEDLGGGRREGGEGAAEESDSSEDEVPDRNTIGDVPLKWYDEEEHIGYDIAGKKIRKQAKRDKIDSFLARADDSKSWHVRPLCV